MCGVQVHTVYGIIMLQLGMHKNSEHIKYQLTSAMWSKIKLVVKYLENRSCYCVGV